jgi:gamma-glutamylcyclotransferase (GGCT)/AIG2-like uncharacterized protein YtfP
MLLAAVVSACFAHDVFSGLLAYIGCLTLFLTVWHGRVCCRQYDLDPMARANPRIPYQILFVSAGIGVAAAVVFFTFCSFAQVMLVTHRLMVPQSEVAEARAESTRLLLTSLPIGTIGALIVYWLFWPRSLSAIFVYGTLKRGEIRERCWPREPVKIEEGTVRGALYDLGPYPALVEGTELVGGEVWHFAAEDLAATLSALDEIEGYRGAADDLYRRMIVECETIRGKARAWTYMYARAREMPSRSGVKADERGICRWSSTKY